MGKPIIGITASQDNSLPMFINHQMYARSIIEAGGIPVLLPGTEGFDDYDILLGRLDGILFSGGVDVHPRHFGEECLEGFSMELMTPERDLYEIKLYQAAYKQDMPILGICRGIQLMAIAGGGGIYQDIDTLLKRPVRIRHAQKAADIWETHRVFVEKESRLSSITQTDEIQVNSMHHQSVSFVPKGYRICGFAPDGVIEAMEDAGKRFCLGVQWHPERMIKRDKVSDELFHAFIRSANSDLISS